MTFTKLGRDVKTREIVEVGFEERKSHVEVVGATGTGKSTLLIDIFIQDILQGKAGAYFCPDGDSLHSILKRLPKDKLEKVFWFDPNIFFPAINLLYCSDITSPKRVDISADFALHIFKRLWDISENTPNLENILRCCFITLIYNKKTLADLPSLLKDATLRTQMVQKIPAAHKFVSWFWNEDFNKWTKSERDKRTESTLNKVLSFLTNATVQEIVSKEGMIDFKTAMQEGHVFLFRMASRGENEPGGITDEGIRLLGSIVLALIVDAAMSRKEGERNFFSLVVDEFQLFASDEFKTILTQLRKYSVATTLAYHYKMP